MNNPNGNPHTNFSIIKKKIEDQQEKEDIKK